MLAPSIMIHTTPNWSRAVFAYYAQTIINFIATNREGFVSTAYLN